MADDKDVQHQCNEQMVDAKLKEGTSILGKATTGRTYQKQIEFAGKVSLLNWRNHHFMFHLWKKGTQPMKLPQSLANR